MAEYYSRAGTVTVASGSTSVTGSGTSFLDLLPGALIWLGTQTMPNVVASVASNTALTLEYASTGAVTGGAYVAVNVPGSQQAVALIAQLYASIGTAVDVTTAEKRVRLGTQTGEAMIYWSDDTIGSAANFRWRAGFLAGAQDVWRIQRSANGTTWTDALTINRTTGVISITGVTVTTGQITDAGTVGIASIQAETQADGRAAIDAAASSHTHSIANVTGLEAALDGKAPINNPTFTNGLSSDGLMTINNDAIIGRVDGGAALVVRGAAGFVRGLNYFTGSSIRWNIRCDSTAESGANAGSDLSIFRFSDAGGGLGAMVTLRRSDGAVLLPSVSTTASAANAFLDSANSNRLLRSTSSVAYKRDIETLEFWRADAFLASARPVWYRSKSEVDNPNWGYYGFIAEELAAINPALVVWGYQADQYETVEWDEERTWTEGEGDDAVTRTETVRMSDRRIKPGEQMRPDGVMYDRLTVFLTAIAQDQAAKIAALEAANADMAARLLAIEGRLAAAGI